MDTNTTTTAPDTTITREADGLYRATVTVDGRTRTFSEYSTYEAALETADRAERMHYSETLNKWVTIPAQETR